MDAKVITIANKLAKKDSVTGLDVWYKTKLHDITYSIERITAVNGTVVSVGQVVNLLIPFSGAYLHYRDWVNSQNREAFYTMTQGDYIFIDIDLDEDITPTSIVTLKSKYSPDVCKVSSVIEVPKRNGVLYQLKVTAI
jgi:hypothetical protein